MSGGAGEPYWGEPEGYASYLRFFAEKNFTNALDKMCQYIVSQYAEHNFDPEILEKEEVKVLMHFYKCVMTGVMLDWMDHRMSYDLTEYAGKIRALYGNTFEKTLEKAAGAKPAQLKII